MKTNVIGLFFSLLAFGADAQRQEGDLQSRADQYYHREQYNLAIQYYQELAALSDQDAVINYQLAESYRKTFKYAEAEAYYLKSYYQASKQFPLAIYYYALMLKRQGEYDESIAHFSKFLVANQTNQELIEQLNQTVIDRAGSEMAKKELVERRITYPVKLETLSSIFNDYAPTILDTTTLVITSSRVASNRTAIDERYGEAFTDNLYFTKENTSWQNRTKEVFNQTNTRYNDGSGCFNTQRTKYYFTVCGRDSERCRIFVSVLKNSQWTEPTVLNDNINVKNAETKHPAISNGGDTLLFSSNRSGGFGKYDIWMSINSGTEQWGPAMNVGNIVNTPLNELAPSFTRFPHVFFLSSDGHQNYGGQDLYMAKTFSDGTVALYNLDYPFNSSYDDCFISFSDQKVYFSSNRAGGIGGFDIYSATIPSLVSVISKLSLKSKAARGDVTLIARTDRINHSDLLTARNEDRIEYENLTYEKKKIVDMIIANEINHIASRATDFPSVSDVEYEILSRIAAERLQAKGTGTVLTKANLVKLNFPANSAPEISITGFLKDSISEQLLRNRKILLVNGSGEIIKTTQTNEVGRFRFAQVTSGQNLYLRFTFVPNNFEKLFVDELQLTDSKTQYTDGFENIYFDFDQYTLRSEAKLVLNDLAEFLRQAPTTQVEVYAYADDRGKDAYNLLLTQKRGQAVLNYLASQGVDQTAIAVSAKGRQENQTTYLEIQRQFNRRVEFYLHGETPHAKLPVKTYILKIKSDWESLSKATGISITELKKLNGTLTDGLQLYQPVRIPITASAISDLLFFTIL